jgi:raffinose/stachyose/melibiose transport system permease protein
MQTAVSGHAAAPASRFGRKSLGRRAWAARWCYLFMVPSVLLLLLFSVYPLFASWYYSLFEWNGIGAPHSFIGLQNFVELVHDSYFWGDLGRTAWFAGVTTPAEMVVSLLVAIVLNDRALRLGPIFRTLFFIPVVTTTAVISIIMSFVFAAFQGPVNRVLLDLHLTSRSIDFLGNPHSVMWIAMLIFVWKWMGQPMIYWLAGLQTIPLELYEAAKVDGARFWAQTVHVTVPLLAPFAVIIGLITAVGNLQVFAFLQALTGGGPLFSSETIELFIFRTAFGTVSNGSASGNQRFGYASAAGILFGLCVMLVVLIQGLALRRYRPATSEVAGR